MYAGQRRHGGRHQVHDHVRRLRGVSELYCYYYHHYHYYHYYYSYYYYYDDDDYYYYCYNYYYSSSSYFLLLLLLLFFIIEVSELPPRVAQPSPGHQRLPHRDRDGDIHMIIHITCHVCVNYIYIYMYICMCVYIYIYIDRYHVYVY